MSSAVVSIIVPVYKTPIPLLRRFLRSALSQTLADIQLVAVDDASPDECPDILDAAAAKDRRLTVWHRSTNGRAGVARNDGLARAGGRYVTFADADDLMRPNMCETLVALASWHNADVVACSWSMRDQEGHLLNTSYFPDRQYDLTVPRQRAKCYRTLNYALWNKLFRREVIATLRFAQFEANIGEDLLFNIAALCRSRVMVTTAYVGYDYIVHNGSATGRSSKGMPYLRTLIRSGEAIRETVAAGDDSKIGRKYAERLLLKRFAIGCGWIAEQPDPNERAAMWAYWRQYLQEGLLSSLKFFQLLAWWYRRLTTTRDASSVYRWTRLANRITDPLSVLDRLEARLSSNRFLRSVS